MIYVIFSPNNNFDFISDQELALTHLPWQLLPHHLTKNPQVQQTQLLWKRFKKCQMIQILSINESSTIKRAFNQII